MSLLRGAARTHGKNVVPRDCTPQGRQEKPREGILLNSPSKLTQICFIVELMLPTGPILSSTYIIFKHWAQLESAWLGFVAIWLKFELLLFKYAELYLATYLNLHRGRRASTGGVGSCFFPNITVPRESFRGLAAPMTSICRSKKSVTIEISEKLEILEIIE